MIDKVPAGQRNRHPNGEPVSLRNLSGNPPPGIYHYEIIIDGKVVFDLKYIV
jgi:hypothetical protein